MEYPTDTYTTSRITIVTDRTKHKALFDIAFHRRISLNRLLNEMIDAAINHDKPTLQAHDTATSRRG